MKRIFVLLFLLAFTGLSVRGQQSVEELRRRIAAAEAEIKATNELIVKTETDRKNNRSQLQLVRNNINNRRRIISDMDKQIALINGQINAKSADINRMEQELAELKAEYAAMIRAAYKSQHTNNMLAFLFASEDFNDMTQRIFYIKRYTALRERKAQQIDSVAVTLQADVAGLAVERDSLARTVRGRSDEVRKLGVEEQKFRQIDTSLGSQVRQYNQRIAQQQRQIKGSQEQIQRILAEEARRASTTQRSAAEEEAIVLLSGQFDQNKGKLPYPVSGGVIIDRFGKHRDPDNPNVEKNQLGVVLAVERGAPVRAVFNGNVHAIMLQPGLGNIVMIRHGNYFTTYANLETVSVKVGDPVATNQQIGKIYSGINAENYILPFTVSDISKSTQAQFLNPELWLRR